MIAALQLSGQRKLDEEMTEMKENMTGRAETLNIRENDGVKNTITSVELFEKVQQVYSEGLADGQLQHWAYNYSIDKKGERDSSKGGRERGSVKKNSFEEGINTSIIDNIGMSSIDKNRKSSSFLVENMAVPIEEERLVDSLRGDDYGSVSSSLNSHVDRNSHADVEVRTSTNDNDDDSDDSHIEVNGMRGDSISQVDSAGDSSHLTATETGIRRSTLTNNVVPHPVMPSVIPAASVDFGISSTLNSTSISTSTPTSTSTSASSSLSTSTSARTLRVAEVETARPSDLGVDVVDNVHVGGLVSTSKIPPRVLDLHECPLSVAKAAIDYELREIYCEHEGGGDTCLIGDDNTSFNSYRDVRLGSVGHSIGNSLPSLSDLNSFTSSNKNHDVDDDGIDSDDLKRNSDKKIMKESLHSQSLDRKIDSIGTVSVETERRSQRHNRKKIGAKSVGPNKNNGINKETKISTSLDENLSDECDKGISKHEILQNQIPFNMLQMLHSLSDDTETLNNSIKVENTSPRSLCTYDLHIITGRGRHLNSSGTRGVLMKEIKEYLYDNYGIKVEKVQGNDGCIIVTRSSLNRWLLEMSTI